MKGDFVICAVALCVQPQSTETVLSEIRTSTELFLSYMHELYSQSILRWTCKHSTTIKEGEAYNVMYLAIID